VLTPGAVATELAATALGEEGLKAYGAHDLRSSAWAIRRRLGAAAAFLASDDSSFMTASEGRRRRRLGATLILTLGAALVPLPRTTKEKDHEKN